MNPTTTLSHPAEPLARPAPEPVILVLADISGYTRYMTANATSLAHSQLIITELFTAILREVELPLAVAEVEGDAVCPHPAAALANGHATGALGTDAPYPACRATERVTLRPSRTASLPPPAGEGRGEGEKLQCFRAPAQHLASD